MISIAKSVMDAIQKHADGKGLSFQEQVREILGEWYLEKIREAKV